MRHPLLSACLAAFCVAAATPSSAQDAPDCGLMCRITGYLSTDHMAAAPSGEAQPGEPAKPRKAKNAAAHRTTAAKMAAPAVVTPAKAAPATAVALTSAKPPMVANTPTPALARAPEPVRATVAAARPTPKPTVEAAPVAGTLRPKPVPAQLAKVDGPAAAKPAVANPASRAPRVVARPAPQTLTASAFIPGSAPAMPAGFQRVH